MFLVHSVITQGIDKDNCPLLKASYFQYQALTSIRIVMQPMNIVKRKNGMLSFTTHQKKKEVVKHIGKNAGGNDL